MRHEWRHALDTDKWYGETLGANHRRAITINPVSTKSGAVQGCQYALFNLIRIEGIP